MSSLACSYLENRIPQENIRYKTFLYALNLLEERKAKTLVETGTARNGCANCLGDGCSTIIFGNWAKENQAFLYSVDVASEALQNAQNGLGFSKPFVHFVQQDSISFLQNFNQPIDFLYLDSLDFDPLNPIPSQMHHLDEAMAAYPHFTEQTIVMIDDCGLFFGGKGRLAISFLARMGWKVLVQDYQVILARE
jgi:hypothetical protein